MHNTYFAQYILLKHAMFSLTGGRFNFAADDSVSNLVKYSRGNLLPGSFRLFPRQTVEKRMHVISCRAQTERNDIHGTCLTARLVSARGTTIKDVICNFASETSRMKGTPVAFSSRLRGVAFPISNLQETSTCKNL